MFRILPSFNLILLIIDIVFIMFLTQIACQFYDFKFLRWLNNAAMPVVNFITGYSARLFRILTNKTSCSHSTLLIFTTICTYLVRKTIVAILLIH